MNCAVVILNWNGKKYLEQFLPSVIRYSKAVADIVVIDNASTDDSVLFLKNKFPEVKIIVNDKNYGFAGGYNEGLKKVNAEFYILLNSDVEVTENWIQPVLDLMKKNENVAAAQPKLLSFHNRNQFEYAGAAGGFIDKYGYPFCRGRIFISMEDDLQQYDDAVKIFWATGACMFVRSNVFQQVNGFDEHFFAHMEEIDLCWRFQLAGYEIMYCPDSVVYHVGGGTLNKSDPYKSYLNFRNNLFMVYKNADPQRVFVVLLVRTILDSIASVKFLFGIGGLKESIAVFKAHKDFHLQKNRLRKTKAVTSEVAFKVEKSIYPKSIVIEYYLKGKRKFSELKSVLWNRNAN